MKKNLAIFDRDSLYSARLLDYICKAKEFQFSVSGYTREESLTDYLTNHQLDVLLVGEELVTERVKELKRQGNIKQMVLLTESRAGNTRDNDNEQRIFKYQSAETIIAQLFELSILRDEMLQRKRQERVNIYTVYSPSCEIYHSAYSCVLANYLSQSIPTLFLNFSMFFKEDLMQNDQRLGLSDLIYYLKQEQDLQGYLKDSISTHRLLSNIRGVKYAFDLFSISEEEVDRLLDEIISLGMFESVVIHMSIFSAAVIRLMKRSDQVLLVKGMRETEDYIRKSFIEQMVSYLGEEIKEKISEVAVREDDVFEVIEKRGAISQSALFQTVKGGKISGAGAQID